MRPKISIKSHNIEHYAHSHTSNHFLNGAVGIITLNEELPSEACISLKFENDDDFVKEHFSIHIQTYNKSVDSICGISFENSDYPNLIVVVQSEKGRFDCRVPSLDSGTEIAYSYRRLYSPERLMLECTFPKSMQARRERRN